MSVSWFDIQQNTFTRWVNDELKRRGLHVKDLKDGLKDGIALINLLEIISDKSLGRYNKHPRIVTQKMENLSIALKFIKDEGLKLVNVGSEDIHEGNLRIILGLIWTLILRYEIRHGDGDDSAVDDLLKWVQSKIPEYDIKGFTGKDWSSGRALCGLVNALRPGMCPEHLSLSPDSALENCTLGIGLGEKIGVDPLILPDELSHPKVDKLAVMTYIAQFRNLPDLVNHARRVQAFGPGLVEGIKDEKTTFTAVVPSDAEGSLAVKVFGEDGSEVEFGMAEKTKGRFEFAYTPPEVGVCTVHITFEGIHIPGSIFTVNILEQESLGGEGKICVYYSTTNSTQKGKTDFFSLQRLLEAKKVHLRPDFEPWIPADLMEKEDREALFRRAGTRHLPIVFIDDEYIGDYEFIQELEELGRLDTLLNMQRQEGKLLTEAEHMRRLLVTPRIT